jgi:hypothetical protein
LTIPINDAHALARAAKQLMDDAALRRRLSIAAQERAIGRFDCHAMAQRSIEIYQRATNHAKTMLASQEPTRPNVGRWVRQIMHDGLPIEQQVG